jgi:hypothetical protein
LVAVALAVQAVTDMVELVASLEAAELAELYLVQAAQQLFLSTLKGKIKCTMYT